MSKVRTEARENLRLAAPIIATQIGTMLMGLVDTAIVGRVGEQALAGVAIGNTLVFAVSMPALGVLTAIEPLTSQAVGAGDGARARRTLREGLRLSFLLTVPFALIAWASLALLPWLKVDPGVVPLARAYVMWRLPSLLPFFVYIAAKTYQQAVLRPRAAVEAVIVANVLHAVADWIAVFGDDGLARVGLPRIGLPAFGGAGAGVATTLSLSFMAWWIAGLRRRIPKGAPDEPKPGEIDAEGMDGEVVRKLFRVGTPIGLQLLAEVGVFSLVTVLMGRLGGRTTAAHQIALGLASFSFMGALGVAQATSVRVGISVGGERAHDTRRAGLTGVGIGVAIMGVWSIVFATFPHALARIFTPDEAVIAAAVPLIRIGALFQLVDGMQVVSAGALRGTGDTRWPLALNVVMHWFVGFPLGLLLGFGLGMGAVGLWFGLTAGLATVAFALVSRFVVLTRKHIRAL
jgi:MATE family multidrug resistance protein